MYIHSTLEVKRCLLLQHGLLWFGIFWIKQSAPCKVSALWHPVML